MEKYLKVFNHTIEEYLNTIQDEELKQATEYALFPGGKRLRPFFMLITLNDLGFDFKQGLYPALALEMIHTYSLIHDDLPAMDNDDFRRGKPSLHKAYGEALAILVADALLTDAFRYFLKAPIPAERKVRLTEFASSASGSAGMVFGQVLDIRNEVSDLKTLSLINRHKTADLFRIAFVGAGIIAGVESLEALEELALNFGLAFQIKDDLDDFGKEAKLSYPNLIGKDESSKKLQEYKEKSLKLTRRILGENEVYQLIERIL